MQDSTGNSSNGSGTGRKKTSRAASRNFDRRQTKKPTGMPKSSGDVDDDDDDVQDQSLRNQGKGKVSKSEGPARHQKKKQQTNKKGREKNSQADSPYEDIHPEHHDASKNENGKRNGGRRKNNNTSIKYPRHLLLDECLTRYNAKDPSIIRGVLRVLPVRDGASFCTCDRGSQAKDVIITGPLERNRALHGDQVFVELISDDDKDEKLGDGNLSDEQEELRLTQSDDKDVSSMDDAGDEVDESWWQDDEIQVDLWDPVVPIQRNHGIPKPSENENGDVGQRKGRVICIVPPKDFGSEINPSDRTAAKTARRIVGTLKRLQNGVTLLTSANKSLPQFRLSKSDAERFQDSPLEAIFSAKYMGDWQPDCKWPPCRDVEQFGQSFSVEDETTALLIDNQVDHGDFPASVLEECQRVVASGEYTNGTECGWKPTPDMYAGRRDLRRRRIFTIDPTTAKDLDDALHIEELDNGEIELGVHIADVSHFVSPNSEIDLEAQRRCTTVYLVDRGKLQIRHSEQRYFCPEGRRLIISLRLFAVLPMLPRPLCEIACSLNENVERLAFSCIWRMKKDGNLVKGHKPWYGRTVIKCCARLDYATAQNIIDKKVGIGEIELSEDFWPASRRPTGDHTIDQVAADVRLMHRVAMARRELRFRNGAVALSAVKLTFQLDTDRETPLLCEPYPIRDSNRLVEEYMLLANYLVAQRLITHAGGKALLRNHDAPLFEGLEKVAEMAKQSIGFQIDISSSESLQRSLNRLGRECSDELVLKCITEMLKLPMRAAEYVAAGTISNDAWSHFALNIPYYTHFTSPIRRYADVIVHRLLQATIDGKEAVDDFVLSERDIQAICERCNEKKEGSRKAQERSDTVFLALYLRRNPLKSQMGVVLSVGQKTFTVFVPRLGISTILFLDEHTEWLKYQPMDENNVMGRRIKLERVARHDGESWKEITIKNFAKIRVKCKCQDKPPISVKLELEGPWTDEGT